MQLSEQLTRLFTSLARLLQSSEGAELSRQDYAVLVQLAAPPASSNSPAVGGTPAPEQGRRSRDLAERTGLDASTMSRRLASLAERGLVTREPDPHDGRAHLLLLTASGAAAVDRERSRRVALVTDALHDWDRRDRDELARLLSQLTDTLETLEGSR